jgi:integrase
LIDAGQQPRRRCPTPRCPGSQWTERTGEVACTVCAAPLNPPVEERRRTWEGGFKSQKAAKIALADRLSKLDRGAPAQQSNLTVREFAETWLRSIETSDLRKSTIAMYERSVRRHILPALGSLKLRDVTPTRLVSWLDELKAKGVGARTVEIDGVSAHKFFADALDRELIFRNPADNSAVRKARPRAKATPPTVWTDKQTHDFLQSQQDDRLFAFWRLATMTGLRRGELAGLKWSDIDLDSGTLTVARTRVVVDYVVYDSTPKTAAGKRTIGIDPATVDALREHRKRQAQEELDAEGAYEFSGLVFVDEVGRPYHPGVFTRLLTAKAKAAGISPIRFHALRHGHATAALQAGIPMKVVSERLGHSGIAITADTYSHVSIDVDRAAAAKIAAAIDGR